MNNKKNVEFYTKNTGFSDDIPNSPIGVYPFRPFLLPNDQPVLSYDKRNTPLRNMFINFIVVKYRL